MKIETNTTKFEFSHGKKPKGFGVWCIKIGSKEFWFNGEFSNVKAQAKAKAKELKINFITVMP